MIIPSIDIMGGQTVQLVGGKEKALDAGSPVPLMQKFRLAGDVAVIDLDAAMGKGNNASLIEPLCRMGRVRVGGGIRSAEAALNWLNAGAHRVIIGTAARPELLQQLPKERVLAAVDAKHGEVFVNGWQVGSGQGLQASIEALRDYVGGFLVTFIEREGRMQGIDLDMCRQVKEWAGPHAQLTVAGGVTTIDELRALHGWGIDAQVGMSIYTGRMDFGDAVAVGLPPTSEKGLWPTVVCSESGQALGFVYSNEESLREAVKTQRGVYWSRRRGLWRKGESSGDFQELLEITKDCDEDALRFVVRQHGRGFCHLEQPGCFGQLKGLEGIEAHLAHVVHHNDPLSNTVKIMGNKELLHAKIKEEAAELCAELDSKKVTSEAADLFYFTLAKLQSAGVTLQDVVNELTLRQRKVSRRPMVAKVTEQ